MWRGDDKLRGERPRLPADEHRRRRRDAAVLAVAAALFLVFAAFETRLPAFGESPSAGSNIVFFLLINLNLLLLILMMFLVIRNFVKLAFERRRAILGSRLRTRLVLAFVSLTLFPAAMLFIVAKGFLDRVFDTWFSVRVESSLNSALEVAETAYQQEGSSALHFAGMIARHVENGGAWVPERRRDLQALLVRAREEYDLAYVDAVRLSGETLAAASMLDFPTGRVPPQPELLAAVANGQLATATYRLGRGDAVRGAAAVRDADGRPVGAVVVDRLIGRHLGDQARDIARSYHEFRELSVLRQPMKNSYVLSLLLITLVIVFSATWFGFQMAKGIAVPLQRLAEGTREVAQGNWDYRIEASGDDELGSLVHSFNRMTGELKQMTSRLDGERRYAETILGNVAAGIVSIDRAGAVTTLNRAAEAMLGLEAAAVRGRDWREMFGRVDLREVGEMVAPVVAGEQDDAEAQVKLSGGKRIVTALVTAAALRDDSGARLGTMLFFEDVSHMLRVERMEAWREVARRIAHEIKNPLTPIQLSAQRLRKRYGAEIEPRHRVVFDECTRTIIRQVEELKRLVNEFASFARLPPADMAPHDINAVVEEALVLFREAHRDIRFEFAPDGALPPVEIDREAVKRAVINLLDNAVAACHAGTDGEAPRIAVATAHRERLGFAQLEIADNGCGVPPEVRGRLFEPYVSTKKDGTGLGLAIVSAIAADHHAYVRVRDNSPRGTRFIIEFPLRRREEAQRAARA